MDRRTFVKGFGGLVVLAAFAGAGGLTAAGDRFLDGRWISHGESVLHTTPDIPANGQMVGPLMHAGIELREDASSGMIGGFYEGTRLFNVNALGATLIALATGANSVDSMASQAAEKLGIDVQPVDVARFFLVMEQSGFLKNTFLVNLYGMTVSTQSAADAVAYGNIAALA